VGGDWGHIIDSSYLSVRELHPGRDLLRQIGPHVSQLAHTAIHVPQDQLNQVSNAKSMRRTEKGIENLSQVKVIPYLPHWHFGPTWVYRIEAAQLAHSNLPAWVVRQVVFESVYFSARFAGGG